MAISSISGVQPTYSPSPLVKVPGLASSGNAEASGKRLEIPTVTIGVSSEQWVVFRVASSATPFMPFDDDGSLVLRQHGPTPGVVLDLKMVDVSLGSSLHIVA